MFEKMNVVSGSPGAGGEYPIQTGFGWSNGVILDLLMLVPDLSPVSSTPNIAFSLLYMLILLL